ncbi:MAG TPA: envelope integrity protein Cei [Pseudonocardiaceae bacterium]|nr:envelope integrity protein Cei [Pseudonocardiaceae bacterium]
MDPIIPRQPGLRRYRRRRPWPALILLVLLATASVTVWQHVLRQAGDSTVQSSCAASASTPAGLPVITPLPYSALNAVDPIPAARVRVRTLNSSSQVGLAGRIALELQQYGFAQVGAPANDPRYPHGDMRCFGQIRFGPNGAGAARTLSLLVPCAQLVRDNRQDTSVDLALGTYFTDLLPSRDALTVLDQLAKCSRSHPEAGGGLQSQAAQAPAVSSQLLAGAHTFGC